ncbi:hypothetical protein BRC68_06320 [Halobacteriales archaeon QH_6_64_20]|jgi:hypothetical protein|nr:MAG: hypothetical protein BRC68_06320 [Halobacteriales archaeon QH_6_64_20]
MILWGALVRCFPSIAIPAAFRPSWFEVSEPFERSEPFESSELLGPSESSGPCVVVLPGGILQGFV